jgi:serine/threonine protein kinase
VSTAQAEAMNDLPPGERLAGKFEIVRKIGEGGMGVVYLARHIDLRTDVAIKIMRPEAMRDTEAIARFDREARAAAALRSPHVARILDVGRHDVPGFRGVPFMVMELLHGRDLGREIQVRGALPVSEAVGYLLEACEAMIEAHSAGIIHRDLKPENLFLCDLAGHRIIKVVDFGISKFIEAEEVRVTQTQSSFGTPLYMSPEQVRSTKNVDARADIWSLGVIAYELLTGEAPFLGETAAAVAVAITIEPYPSLSHRRRDVSPELDRVIARALEKSREDRFPTVRDFAAALRPFREGSLRDAAGAGPISIAPRPMGSAASKTMRVSSAEVPLRAQRRAAPAWLYVVVGALLVAVVGLSIYMTTRKARSGDSARAASDATSSNAAMTAGPNITSDPSHGPQTIDPSPVTPSSAILSTPEPSALEPTPTGPKSAAPSPTVAIPPTASAATTSTSAAGTAAKPTSTPTVPPVHTGADPNPHHI